MPSRRLLIGLVAIALVVAGCSSDDPAEPTSSGGARVISDIVYREVDGAELSIDVYRPQGEGPWPAVLVLYGRAWRDGSKEGAGAVAEALSDRGFVAFAPDYREAPPGGRWHAPAPFTDVLAAARWIESNEARFDVEPGSIGALGWSAGANLALLLGTRGNSMGADVGAVVSWSAPTDLAGLRSDVGEIEGLLLVNYLGCELEDCPDLWTAMSPVDQAAEDSAPALIVNSESELVPIDQPRDMLRALESAGVVGSDLLVLEGDRHGSAFARDVWEETVSFFDSSLGRS